MNTTPRLHLIDLDQDLPGQRRFISCWVSISEDLAFIVDPGPPSTADHLTARLEKLGVSHLDFILLTHVHLDHGGCTARILNRWPNAQISLLGSGRTKHQCHLKLTDKDRDFLLLRDNNKPSQM